MSKHYKSQVAVTCSKQTLTRDNTNITRGTENEANCHYHNENMPIQIYRKFHLQKLKIFR